MFRRSIFNKLTSSVLAVILALSMALTAVAAYPIPTDTGAGTISVTMKTSSGDTIPGGELTVYKVGEVTEASGNYFFTLTDDFKDSGCELDNITQQQFDDTEFDAQLAQDLTDYVFRKGLEGDTYQIDGSGNVTLTGLYGLYLFIQPIPADGYYAVSPFLASTPHYVADESGGRYEYYVDASPKTQVFPGPIKDVDADGDGEYGDDGKGVNVGDDITYKIDYENTNYKTVTITVTDVLDERIDFVSASDGGTYNASDRTVTWVIDNVAPNATGSVTFTATVNEKAMEHNEVSNTARVKVGDNSPSVSTNTIHTPRRSYFPIDEEIVPDYTDRSTWVKDESVNEYNAIEIEMSTNLPIMESEDLLAGDFTINFHEVLDSELVLDEADADFLIFVDGNQLSHDYYTITLASGDSRSVNAVSPLGIMPLSNFGDTITDGCTFHVDIKLTEMYRDGVIDESHLQGDTELIIFFFADLEGTGLNGSYGSTVWYEVWNDDKLEFTSNKDVVYVYTYEIDIAKTDSSNGRALADATFGVYYDENCTEPVSRYNEVYTATTDSHGEAVFYGLGGGTYYVKELEAPQGYELSDEVHVITLGSESGSRVEISIGNTPSSGTSHHTTGGTGGGGGSGSGGGGSSSGGPGGGSSGEGDSGGTVWDLLPLPQTGQGWAMLIAVCIMVIAGIGLLVVHLVGRKN